MPEITDDRFEWVKAYLETDFHGIIVSDDNPPIHPRRKIDSRANELVLDLIQTQNFQELLKYIHLIGIDSPMFFPPRVKWPARQKLARLFKEEVKSSHMNHSEDYFNQFKVDTGVKKAYNDLYQNGAVIWGASGTPSCCENNIQRKLMEGGFWDNLGPGFKFALTPRALPDTIYPGGAIASPYVKKIVYGIARKLMPNARKAFYDDTALGALEMAQDFDDLQCFVKDEQSKALDFLRGYDPRLSFSQAAFRRVEFGATPGRVQRYLLLGIVGEEAWV